MAFLAEEVERCIEEEHYVRVEVVVVVAQQHTLVRVEVEEERWIQVVVGSSDLTAAAVCSPALVEESSNLAEGCAGVVRNVHGLSLRNAKHCNDHYDFCCACFLLLCLHSLGLHRCHQKVVGCENVDACFHPGSFRKPMRQRPRQRQAGARRHFR